MDRLELVLAVRKASAVVASLGGWVEAVVFQIRGREHIVAMRQIRIRRVAGRCESFRS